MMCRWAVFFFAAVQLQASIFDWFSPLSDKAKRAQTVMEGFDAIVEKAIKEYQVPGVAIGIVVDGHLVYAKGFGCRDLEKKLPVTCDTLFAIGSCTKAFTSFAIGTLVDEGLLHWDQKIIDIYPEFRLYDAYATQNLTMRDLLTHRSGMPQHNFMWYNSSFSRLEVMRRLRYLEPSCNLRERYQYNNLMYLAAGFAVEQLLGKEWEDLIRERILQRLEMHHTNFSIEDMQKTNDFAAPYVEKNGKLEKMQLRDISLIGPAGSMNSSVNDLSHWMQMQLNSGVYKSAPLINPATLQEMHTPQVIVPGAPETKESLIYAYGLGWGIASYRGSYFLSHDAVSDGFTSTMGLLPQEGVGIIVLANRNLTPLARFLSLSAIDRILELPPLDWVKGGLEGIKKEKQSAKDKKEDLLCKKGTSPSHAIEHFVGKYEHPGYGIVSIELVDGKLVAVFNGITSFLEHWHYDVFSVVEETQHTIWSRAGTKMTFRNNMKGEVDELIIPFEPSIPDIVFKRKHEDAYSHAAYFRRFVGLYEIYGYTVEIALRKNTLCAIIPGQPVYELMPSSENEFTVKSMTGYNVRFLINPEGKVEEILLVQPYGAFTAKPKR